MEEDELENQGGGDVKRQTGGIGKDLPTLRKFLTTTVFKYPYGKSSFLIR